MTAAVFVYRIFSVSGDLLYVGQSTDVARRLTAHRKWTRDHRGHRVVSDGPYTAAQATVIERRAIICEAPLLNKSWRTDHEPSLAYCVVVNARVAYRYLTGGAEPILEAALRLRDEFGILPVPADNGTLMYQLLEVEDHYLHRAELAAAA